MRRARVGVDRVPDAGALRVEDGVGLSDAKFPMSRSVSAAIAGEFRAARGVPARSSPSLEPT